MDKKEMLSAMNNTMQQLLQHFDNFTPARINVVPFAGSWTAGQLAQHLVMSGSGFIDMINGPVKPTERNPEEKVENIKTDFLNFNIKMSSPDFVVPPKKDYDKQSLVSALSEMKTALASGIDTLDMSQTCTVFELPVLGYLTRIEAVSFVLYHTQRHIHQLEKIKDAVPAD